MTNRRLRVALTVGLIPLWAMGVFAGTLLTCLGSGALLSLVAPEDNPDEWIQPPAGRQVTDMRISMAYHEHPCGVLALTGGGRFYLYTVDGETEKTTIRVTDATEELNVATLPAAFVIHSVAPLELDIDDSVPGTSKASSTRLDRLPEGRILHSGQCYRSYAPFSEWMDAALVEGNGLWLKASRRSDGSLFSSKELLLMASSVCAAVVMMGFVVRWLYRRIWRTGHLGYR